MGSWLELLASGELSQAVLSLAQLSPSLLSPFFYIKNPVSHKTNFFGNTLDTGQKILIIETFLKFGNFCQMLKHFLELTNIILYTPSSISHSEGDMF